MPRDRRRPYDWVKRATDIGLSAVGLIVTAPIQACVAALVLAAHGRPILFRQDRPGLDGRIFELVKFRTMRNVDAHHTTDVQRLTRWGTFLRSTSLDELPTLWNVFKGDMSLVGPRPLLVRYLPLYSREQARRHEVRPGVTGLAQVSGRNALSWKDKLSLDVEYIENRCLMLDLRILLATVHGVLTRDGISQAGFVTMSEFTGAPRVEDAHGNS